MEHKLFQVGVKGIITQGDKVLLLRSKAKNGKPEYWDLPGGRLWKDDASIEDGLKRELTEELPGIQNIEAISYLGAVSAEKDFSDGSGLMLLFFHVNADVPENLEYSEEHATGVWASRNEMENFLSTEPVLASVQEAIKQYCLQVLNNLPNRNLDK